MISKEMIGELFLPISSLFGGGRKNADCLISIEN